MKTINFTKAILLGVAVCLTTITMNAQVFKWAAPYNDSQNMDDISMAVTTDASGNVYVTGRSKSCLQSGDEEIVTRKYNASGGLIWSQPYNGGFFNCNYGDFEQGNAIAVDAQGNVWVTGRTYQGTTYNEDLFLLKYNAAGTQQWIKFYHDVASYGVSMAEGTCIAIYNTAGNGTDVYVGGKTVSTANGARGIVLKSDQNYNSGQWGWSNTPYIFSGNYPSYSYGQTAFDIKVDASNTYVYVTGWVSNTSTLHDCFTAKLSASTGAVQGGWPQTYNYSPTNDWERSFAMILDGGGNVYIAGYRTTSTNRDAIVIKYSTNGGPFVWISPWNNNSFNGSDEYWDIAGFGPGGGGAGTVVYAGGYTGQSGGNDYLLAAINISNGSFLSSWNSPTNPQTYDGYATGTEPAGTDKCKAIDYEPTTNRVYMTGFANETIPAPSSINITNLGYNANNGALVWRTTYDYNSDQINQDDNVYGKYSLTAQYNACYGVDDIYVTGASRIDHSGNLNFDYITLKYGCGSNCFPCSCPQGGGRMMNAEQQQEAEAGAVAVYPNPFTASAVIRLSPETKISNAVLSVYDITGRLVSSVNNIASTTIVIDRGDLPDGMYFYKLIDNGNMISNGKFVITE
ncbi:MAG: T9SS type A sorting domain-containing protein [Bacteroidetes bacterium]|nr:T9SS type A sorting domain-containing protein [Bacteroidota bacterium]